MIVHNNYEHKIFRKEHSLIFSFIDCTQWFVHVCRQVLLLWFRFLSKSTYKKLLIHLCIAMVGLYSSFIVGTFTMPVPVLCGIVSALMHYFFLVTFLWMASIAIQAFRNIVQPFKPEIESYHGLSAVICWGTL